MILRIIFFWLLSLNIYAIDKGHFKNISNHDLVNYIMPTFKGVPAYYLNYIGGDPLTVYVSKSGLLSSLVSTSHDETLVSFLNPNDIKKFQMELGKNYIENYEIKKMDSRKIIAQLYKNSNRTDEKPKYLADMILLGTLKKNSPSFVYHINKATGKKHITKFDDDPMLSFYTKKFKQEGLIEVHLIDSYETTFARSVVKLLQEKNAENDKNHTVNINDEQLINLIISSGKEQLLTVIVQ